MATGRFDGRKVVYLAGVKARERGRDRNITDSTRHDQLEILRRKMAEYQVDFLASPEDNPEIRQGKEDEWNKIKLEYSILLRKGTRFDGIKEESKENAKTRSKVISQAAARAVKSHMHDAIVYARSLSQLQSEEET